MWLVLGWASPLVKRLMIYALVVSMVFKFNSNSPFPLKGRVFLHCGLSSYQHWQRKLKVGKFLTAITFVRQRLSHNAPLTNWLPNIKITLIKTSPVHILSSIHTYFPQCSWLTNFQGGINKFTTLSNYWFELSMIP